METLSNPVVLCYHGCTKAVAESVLAGEEHLRPSDNDYDWLGGGIYFWEADPVRGLEWATERYGEKDVFVIGAAVHLGCSLNLMSRHAHDAVVLAYSVFKKLFSEAGVPLPTNGVSGKGRKLDCSPYPDNAG